MSKKKKFEFLGNGLTVKFYFFLYFGIKLAAHIGIYRRQKSSNSE